MAQTPAGVTDHLLREAALRFQRDMDTARDANDGSLAHVIVPDVFGDACGGGRALSDITREQLQAISALCATIAGMAAHDDPRETH